MFFPFDQNWESLIDILPGIAFRAANVPGYPMVYLSQGCHELIGYTSADLLNPNSSITYKSFIHPDDMPVVLVVIEEAIAQQGRYVVEYRIRNCYQQICWVSETGHALLDASGQVVGLEGFIRDITALKQAETDLIEAYALLEKQQDLIRSMEAYYQTQVDATGTELNSWVIH